MRLLVLVPELLRLKAGGEPTTASQAAGESKDSVRFLEIGELVETDPRDVLSGENVPNDGLIPAQDLAQRSRRADRQYFFYKSD